MIRINRSQPAPRILSTSNANDRYRHRDVVDALLQMQHAKCCYCEIYIADSGAGKQVEHFRPQSLYEDLRYAWDNLLLACAECNHAKLDQFPESESKEPLLLDPSDPSIDPEDHIAFIVPERPTDVLAIQGNGNLPVGLPVARNGSARGAKSIQLVKLYASQHVKRRGEVADKLRHAYLFFLTENQRIASGTGSPEKAGQLKDDLQEAMQDHSNYAGFARAFHREYDLARFGIQPR